MAPSSSVVKAPWGVASWVGPQARRLYSERPWGSNPQSNGGSCTAEEATREAEQAWSRPTSGVVDASGGSKEADTIGGLAFPLGVSTASRITAVKVDNLAMVDSVSIELARGLIAITGETGAGKSLISSAFSLAAGARVRGADLVGSKGSTAAVELHLELAGVHRASTTEVLKRLGVPLEDGGRRLTVTRTVGKKGSSASINGFSVKVGALRELMSPLIYTVDANAFDLFSRADARLRALDRMLAPAEVALADEVRRVVAKLKQAEACRARLEQRCRFEGGDADEDTSLLHHWVEELDEFEEGEMAFMDKMRAVVNDFVDNWGEEMLGPLAEHLLSSPALGQDGGEEKQGGNGNSGVGKEGLSDLWPRLSRIHEGMEDLEASRTKVELARQLAVDRSNPESISHVLDKVRGLLIDAEDENVGLSQGLLEETHEDLNSLEDCLKRAGEKLERSVESLPVLPITLEEVEERTVKWRDLSRKHAISPERLGSMQAQLRVELDELVVAAEALPLAREKEEQWRVVAERVAGELSAVRRRVATQLEDLVNPVMQDLGLEGATLKVLVEDSKALGPAGADRVQFLLEANQGQTRGAVDAVASSGEKSRLLLLLETRLPPPHAQAQQPGAELAGSAGARDDGGLAAAGVEEEGGEDTVSALAAGGGGGGGSGGSGGAEALVRAPPCAVLYDEIDAHVGGRTAVAVGKLLANQGRDSQVVVVTHTASVAALADQHLVVDKATADSRAASTCSAGTNDCDGGGAPAFSAIDQAAPALTATAAAAGEDEGEDKVPPSLRRSRRHGGSEGGLTVSIREVGGRKREEEVARMAAGDMGGEAAAELAREMLRYSRRQD
eukprot:g9936.t1